MSTEKLEIPEPIANFVNAINDRDKHAFIDALSADAVITDEGHQYRGRIEIKKWNDEKNIGAEVALVPIEIRSRDERIVLTAKVDGNFDKTGLPDPFLMDLHFTLSEGYISKLEYSLAGVLPRSA